jgi:hypothetical protein
MATEKQLAEIFKSAGRFEPFDCADCQSKDIFISGPHSHTCQTCSNRATRGWYTIPMCDQCFHNVVLKGRS